MVCTDLSWKSLQVWKYEEVFWFITSISEKESLAHLLQIKKKIIINIGPLLNVQSIKRTTKIVRTFICDQKWKCSKWGNHLNWAARHETGLFSITHTVRSWNVSLWQRTLLNSLNPKRVHGWRRVVIRLSLVTQTPRFSTRSVLYFSFFQQAITICFVINVFKINTESSKTSLCSLLFWEE